MLWWLMGAALAAEDPVAVEKAEKERLYVGLALPVEGLGSSGSLELNASPVSLEWRLKPRQGLRLEADVRFRTGLPEAASAYQGTRLQLSAPHYFGAQEGLEGPARGGFVGPLAMVGLDTKGDTGAGLSLGYKGTLGASLNWRSGLGLAWTPGRELPVQATVTLFEIGAFAF